MTMILKNLMLFFIAFLSLNLFSQTLVNTEWEILYGTPDEVDWSASGTDNSNNLLETGNTIVTNEGTNIITTKKDRFGQVVWEKLFDGTDSSNDYGIAVKSDNSNNVYVAGATNDLTDNAFDFVILKYNPSGTLQWEYTYAGNYNGNDLPIDILPDGSGNVYVTGLSEDSTEQDILTLKLSSTGTLVWEARYDHVQLPDIPAGMEFDDSGNVVVAGGSADTAKWEIVTLKYSPSGTLLNETRVSSTTFEQPRAFTRDGQGNFYITGQTGTGGPNPDVKTIKLDSALNIVWEQEHDGTGFEDMGNSLCVNNEGDVFITGYTGNSDGSQDMLTLRYRPDGTEVWAKTIRPLYPQGTAAGKKITADGFGRIYVAGETQLKANPDMVVIGYDTSGLKRWHRIFSNGPTGVEVPTGITLDLLGDILVTGISKDGTSSKNFTVKYSPYERYRSVELDSSGNPLYWKRQVIVGFSHDKVLKDNIDQKEKLYGKPDFFLDSSCVSQLYGKLGKVLDGTKFVKAFPTLDTDCKETTGRHGNTVPIPPFWSTFVLDLPPGADAVPLVDSLRCLFPTVRYAHLNYAGDISSNDPLFGEQASLHPIPGLDEGHINVEPAWDITVGDEAIRVGVFDTGVEWRHEDYLWNQFNQLSSVVAAGWDFGFGVDMRSETLSNPDYRPDRKAGGHGTNSAGVIGAVRNNSKGVAGIAGGDKGGGIKGTTLYSLRILVETSDPVVNGYTDLSYLADAIVKSALTGTSRDTTYSYGLDIQNHSYGFSINMAAISNESIDVLKDAVHVANRANVIIVAASGNHPNPNQAPDDYPASLNDDWVIKVGGRG